MSRPGSCSGLGPLSAGAALPPEKLAPKLSLPPQLLPRTRGSLSTQVVVTDLSLLSQRPTPCQDGGRGPPGPAPRSSPSAEAAHTYHCYSIPLAEPATWSHPEQCGECHPSRALWGHLCGGTPISSTQVPPETADVPRDAGLPTCPRPHTAPLNSPPQGPRSAAAVDGSSSMARNSALCPSRTPSTAQHPGAHMPDLVLWVKPPSGLGGTPGQRPGRLRSDHLTPHPGWHHREHEREEPGPMGRQCGQLRGLSRRPNPPHSTLVPKVPLKGLEQDSLSEGLSHLCRSPTPHPQGQRTRPPITSVSLVFAGDAKIPPLHFRGLAPCP